MTLDALKLNQSISNYRNAANSYLKVSDDAKKLGLKEEQTIKKNESRYDLDGTLKEEHLPIGSLEKAKKKEEDAEKFGLLTAKDRDKKTDKADKTDKTEGNILDKDVRGKEKDDEKGLFGLKKDKKDGFAKDPPDCECETCRKRRYQDDSDDSAVSFQMPTAMSPAAAKSRVRSHELEHVRREGIKARQEGKHIVSQTVQIKTDTCSECGRVYVSGGLTRTVTRVDMRDFHRMFMLGFDGKDELGRDIS
ncbi:MAG: hypothetical protein IK990_05090 [Ruminiclostridium sp.]|nr:hypothetical protein [Ruminiclostridium sp.]